MEAFEYANPAKKEQVVELLAGEWGKTAVLAGGTDLLSLMKDDLEQPERLVNLKSIDGLGGIEEIDGGLRIGALATLGQLVADENVQSSCPSLVQAADGIRSAQLQTMGTVGGELLQRPRCWYYRAGFGLLAQRDGRSMVLEGDNRYHAILGNDGPAYFVHPSSLAPALIALGAVAHVFGPEGEREMPVASLWRSPTHERESETTLAKGEILTGLALPATTTANATYEVRQREALDWPLAAAAVALEIEGGTVMSARVVLGHVAPVPYVAESAGAALVGKSADAAAEAASEAAVAGSKALSHNVYKVQLAKVATRRAIRLATGMEV